MTPPPPWKGTPYADDYGLQPGSVYIFEDLFRITNNSYENVKFQISVEGDLADFEHIYVGKGIGGLEGKSFTLENGELVAPVPKSHSGINWYFPCNNWSTLNPAIKHNNYTDVSVAFVIPADADFAPEDVSGTLVVNAWAE